MTVSTTALLGRALEFDILNVLRKGFMALAADVPLQIEWRLEKRHRLPAPLSEVVSIPKGTRFCFSSVSRAHRESRQESGSLFYELIERPMNIHDRALAELKRSRAAYRQEWNFQRIE
jgi:hypothetical protein